MHVFKIALMVLAVVALCTAEAAKKATKKSEKGSTKSSKPAEKEIKVSKSHKRGLYPEPHLGSAYVEPGAAPLEYHHAPGEHLTVPHENGVYGGVYANHLDLHSPAVAATYAPAYGFGGHPHLAHSSYSTYGHGYLGGFPGGLKGLEALLGGVKIEEGIIRVKTITTHVPVAVPHPVPVEVIKKVPVAVPHPVPVEVPRAVKVEVPQPYPVEVPKPYPVEVPKPVPQLVPHPVHVKVPKPYPVEVPTPYTVEVHRPVPVPVPHQVEIPRPAHYHASQKVYTPSYNTKAYSPSYPVIASYKSYAPTYSHPVISVKKCDDDHGYVKSSPIAFDAFSKDFLTVSSLSKSSGHDFHHTPTVSYSKAPSYEVPSYTPTPSYAKEGSYHVPSYTPTHTASYPKVLSYDYGYHSAPEPSYPKVPVHDYSYPSAPAPSYGPGYGYGKVARSFVGVSAHGDYPHGGYKSEVHHHPHY